MSNKIAQALAELVGSPTERPESPLHDAPEAPVGSDTSTMHFSLKTTLGWMPWKEREASLFSLFERSFAAVRCELKFAEMLNEFAMEVEIPNTQVVANLMQDKFTKFFNGKVLAMEIDKLHGIEPVLTKWKDVKLTGLRKTMGMSSSTTQLRSSVETLRNRIEGLEACGSERKKEVDAIKELAAAMIKDTTDKFNALKRRIDIKVYEKCGSKFDTIEQKILSTVRQELSFIATPLPFQHPPEGYEPLAPLVGQMKTQPSNITLDFLNTLTQRKTPSTSTPPPVASTPSKTSILAQPESRPSSPLKQESDQSVTEAKFASADVENENIHSKKRESKEKRPSRQVPKARPQQSDADAESAASMTPRRIKAASDSEKEDKDILALPISSSISRKKNKKYQAERETLQESPRIPPDESIDVTELQDGNPNGISDELQVQPQNETKHLPPALVIQAVQSAQ